MADGLKGRVIAVTGAGSGIGAATVGVLAKAGARIAALDVTWPAVTADRYARIVSHLTLDVTDEAATDAAFARIVAHFGRIDGLATCAGIVDTAPFLDIDAARFRRVMDVNVLGTFLCLKAAGSRMQRGGRMVTIASIAGLRGGGLFGTAAYSASKGAVLALTKNAARTFGPKGIAVNTVAPGSTDTPMTALAAAGAGPRRERDGDGAARPQRRSGRDRRGHRLAAVAASLLRQRRDPGRRRRDRDVLRELGGLAGGSAIALPARPAGHLHPASCFSQPSFLPQSISTSRSCPRPRCRT